MSKNLRSVKFNNTESKFCKKVEIKFIILNRSNFVFEVRSGYKTFLNLVLCMIDYQNIILSVCIFSVENFYTCSYCIIDFVNINPILNYTICKNLQ